MTSIAQQEVACTSLVYYDFSSAQVTPLYNAAGAVTELVALDRTGDGTATTTDNESTKYLYEDTVNASLVTSEIYPDSSDTTSAGTDQVKKTYFLNGQLKTKSDQRGVVMTYAHNAWSVYDDGLRPTSFRMPSGNFQYQVYSGTINDALHRVSGIQEDFSTGSSLTVANYAYNGRGRLVEVDYTQPTVKLRRDEDANGSYEALDQFGRIKTQTWKHSGGALMDHVNYQYDYASNRTARDISTSLYATNNLDQVYGYDSLHRLKNFDEGSMSGSSIASPTKEQDWALDTLGNWNNLTEKTSGSTTLNQNRGHNNANELTTIAGASTYVGHDAAGNMTKVPKPTSWSSAYDLEFDAWNRLVRVKDGGTTVASYSYDGLHRRIVKTVGATTEQHYYNEQWQLLEVRVGTEASAARQKYVWHPYYIDALAQRFWDGNSDGDFLDANEKHFVMHDGNFNVTSVMTTGGSVFERYFYSPYGQLTVLNADFSLDSSSMGDGLSDVANPHTYTGRQYHAESGIYQYRNRYYHAQLGRFVTRDPIGYTRLSLYQYASITPIQSLDPSGLFDIAGIIDRLKPNEWKGCRSWVFDIEGTLGRAGFNFTGSSNVAVRRLANTLYRVISGYKPKFKAEFQVCATDCPCHAGLEWSVAAAFKGEIPVPIPYLPPGVVVKGFAQVGGKVDFCGLDIVDGDIWFCVGAKASADFNIVVLTVGGYVEGKYCCSLKKRCAFYLNYGFEYTVQGFWYDTKYQVGFSDCIWQDRPGACENPWF